MAVVLVNKTGAENDLDQPISGTQVRVGPPPERQSDSLETFAKRVEGRWKEGESTMQAARREYWTNLAFYLGQQWIWWSEQRNTIMPYPRQVDPLGQGRVRLVVNRFGPNVLNVFGRLMRSELTFEVPPSDSSDNVVQGAKRAEKVLEATRVEQDWERVRGDSVLAALFGGTSGIAVEWDRLAGKELPIYDEGTDQVVGTGDITLRAHNVNEFVVQPGVRDPRRLGWWISGLCVPPAIARRQFGLSWMPVPDAGAGATPMYDALMEGVGKRGSRDLVRVLCYYERPGPGTKGGYGCVINGRTVYMGKWPFDFEELNFHPIRQKPVDGRVLGATYLTDAVAVQTAYNFARSTLQEHMKLAGNARLVAPFGAFDEEDLHGAAGDVLWWSPDASGAAPQYLAPPQLPRWLTQEADTLAEELDNVMHVHDISRGIGFSRASGQALSFLAEQDDSSLGHMVFEIKRVWEKIGKQTLTLYGAKAKETRTAQVAVAPGVTDRFGWTGKMLQGQTNVTVPIESVTPKNAAAQLANAKDLWDRKILTDPRKYAKMAGLPADEFGQLLDPDAAKANTENLRMMMGIPEVPADFDDHAVHIAEHNDRCRKTDSYKYAPPEYQEIIDNHVKYHENKAANEFARQSALAGADPAATGVPQADAPIESQVPQGEQEQIARLGLGASLGVTPSGGSAPAGAALAGGSQPGVGVPAGPGAAAPAGPMPGAEGAPAGPGI